MTEKMRAPMVTALTPNVICACHGALVHCASSMQWKKTGDLESATHNDMRVQALNGIRKRQRFSQQVLKRFQLQKHSRKSNQFQ